MKFKECEKCGKEFSYYPYREKRQGTKLRYCSRACSDADKKGKPMSKECHEAKVKWIKDNKDLRNELLTGKGFIMHGELNHKWRGDEVGYGALHGWVKRHLKDPGQCERCGATEKLEWSNKSWEYRREADDWQRLCIKCHEDYDRQQNWGVVKRRFGYEK